VTGYFMMDIWLSRLTMMFVFGIFVTILWRMVRIWFRGFLAWIVIMGIGYAIVFIRWYLFGSLVIYNHFGWCLDQQAVLLRRIGLFFFWVQIQNGCFLSYVSKEPRILCGW
jgi:hypothetical protein